eukprot:jgi/Mesen1/4747/ME000242S03922
MVDRGAFISCGCTTVPWIGEEWEEDNNVQRVGVSYTICAVDSSTGINHPGDSWCEVGRGFFTRPPKGMKVHELVNFIKQYHTDSLGIYLCTFDGESVEWVAGDNDVEQHATLVPLGYEKWTQEEAFFYVMVPWIEEQEDRGTKLDPIRVRLNLIDLPRFNFNLDSSNQMPKALAAPKDEVLGEKKAADISDARWRHPGMRCRSRPLPAGSSRCCAI